MENIYLIDGDDLAKVLYASQELQELHEQTIIVTESDFANEALPWGAPKLWSEYESKPLVVFQGWENWKSLRNLSAVLKGGEFRFLFMRRDGLATPASHPVMSIEPKIMRFQQGDVIQNKILSAWRRHKNKQGDSTPVEWDASLDRLLVSHRGNPVALNSALEIFFVTGEIPLDPIILIHQQVELWIEGQQEGNLEKAFSACPRSRDQHQFWKLLRLRLEKLWHETQQRQILECLQWWMNNPRFFVFTGLDTYSTHCVATQILWSRLSPVGKSKNFSSP